MSSFIEKKNPDQLLIQEETEQNSSYNTIVEWLNQASLINDNSKLENLFKIQEILLNKEPNLLDNFFDEVIAFQIDRSAEVRRFVVGFIEETCKKDADVLPRVVTTLSLLLKDQAVQVQKRVIQAASHIYKLTLNWLSKARIITEEMISVWNVISSIKTQIIKMIDSDNDGVRTLAVKFAESVVLIQTYPEIDSIKRENDFSLEDIPLTLKIARRRKLEEEANLVFELLLKFHNSPHISSVNLMTCMGTLTLIAKMRTRFMGNVIDALVKLNANLPPTLTKSQVSSVRKHLKMQLLNLLKHPGSYDYQTTVTTLLKDLGATTQEITKNLPKPEEIRRRQKRLAESQSTCPTSSIILQNKRAKLEDDDFDPEPDGDTIDEFPIEANKSFQLATYSSSGATTPLPELFEEKILSRFTPKVAAQIVLSSLPKIPDQMPSNFGNIYGPIYRSGQLGKEEFAAKDLAMWIFQQTRMSTKMFQEDDEKKDMKDHLLCGQNLKPFKQKIRTLKLSEITKPLDSDVMERLMANAVCRILSADKTALMAGVVNQRIKIITILASTYNENIRTVVLKYLMEDMKSNIDIALAWLYEEYSYLQGFATTASLIKEKNSTSSEEKYNKLFCNLVKHVMKIQDARERDNMLNRLYFEAPLITEEATNLLKAWSSEPQKGQQGITLLKELVTRRPPKQLLFLNALLEHTSHESQNVRDAALQAISELYNRTENHSIVEEYAILYLGFLRLSGPPDVLLGASHGRPQRTTIWTEDTIRACLYLYLSLLPLNQTLIHELARVYVQTNADVKRVILRHLEGPVRGMGVDSPQLLTLVEQCPKGAETLVTRVIHILTDKNPPSAELVARVRDLYHTRVSDVRFLIPVLNGLTKKEVIAALPKLIKLNPIVVKEVFNRLLGTQTDTQIHTSPLTPAELLIALHNIDPTKCELKTVIKATSLCFAEHQAYSQEVLAVVMQHLMEQNPLPTLLMRTVIQSLSLHPRLIGFVMNILQRLILKQVWKQKKVWEGFIKCCQRTKPQSFQVLLQLPPRQLQDVFDNSPELRQPLLSHVMAFTENQRAHIPQSILDVLLGNKTSLEESEESKDGILPIVIKTEVKEEPLDIPFDQPAPPGLD